MNNTLECNLEALFTSGLIPVKDHIPKEGGEPARYVSLYHLCAALGIDHWGQVTRWNTHPALKGHLLWVKDAHGNHPWVATERVPLWIYFLPIGQVRTDSRPGIEALKQAIGQELECAVEKLIEEQDHRPRISQPPKIEGRKSH